MRTLLVRLCTTVAVLVATSGSIEAQTDCPRGSLPAYAHNDYENSLPPQLTIVLVGWHPASLTTNVAVDTMLAWQQRISRAPRTPLDERVRLLSIDYGKTMGRWWVTSGGRKRWLAAIRAAKDAAPDRLVRAHNVPLDKRVYRELFAAGVDLIGTKQLRQSLALLSEQP